MDGPIDHYCAGNDDYAEARKHFTKEYEEQIEPN